MCRNVQVEEERIPLQRSPLSPRTRKYASLQEQRCARVLIRRRRTREAPRQSKFLDYELRHVFE